MRDRGRHGFISSGVNEEEERRGAHTKEQAAWMECTNAFSRRSLTSHIPFGLRTSLPLAFVDTPLASFRPFITHVRWKDGCRMRTRDPFTRIRSTRPHNSSGSDTSTTAMNERHTIHVSFGMRPALLKLLEGHSFSQFRD